MVREGRRGEGGERSADSGEESGKDKRREERRGH